MLYRLSRHSKLHNYLRVIGNNVLWILPEGIKYRVGKKFRQVRYPYKVASEGTTVIQIGAPWDLLKAGRSRAAYFSKFVGDSGRVIVFEPDAENVEQLEQFCARNNISWLQIFPIGAWDKKAQLVFLRDPNHPAANLIEEVFDENRKDLSNFDRTEIEVDSLDNQLGEMDLDNIKLLSITSNGSESKILDGAKAICERVEYLSIIGDDKEFPQIKDYGFELVGGDDRGYLYKRKSSEASQK